MEISQYSDHERTLKIEFRCQRCKKTELMDLKSAIERSDEPRFLSQISEPNGWMKLHIHGPLLCPECIAGYNKFMMKNGE